VVASLVIIGALDGSAMVAASKQTSPADGEGA
jgi:hypothetical protein